MSSETTPTGIFGIDRGRNDSGAHFEPARTFSIERNGKRMGNKGEFIPPTSPGIDWQKEFAGRDRARAEAARVDDAARARAAEFRQDSDPIAQLVKRCHAVEERCAAMEQRVTELERGRVTQHAK